MNAMTPPQKERIIDQAMHMFVSQGIKSVRMDDIAQQLGVSKRTLYEMFGDKEGLLYLAMERYSERNRQRWNELTADAHDVLEAMFMVLGEVMDNAEVSRRMMDNLKKFYPAVHDKLMREGMVKNRTSLRAQDFSGSGLAKPLTVTEYGVTFADKKEKNYLFSNTFSFAVKFSNSSSLIGITV